MRPLVPLLLVLLLTPPAAAFPPRSSLEVARLIEQLGSDRYLEREAASKQFEAFGESALPVLWKAATDSKDAEVRKRAERAALAIENELQKVEGVRACLQMDETVVLNCLGEFWKQEEPARSETLKNVARIFSRDAWLLSRLANASRHKELAVRRAATETLRLVGPPAKEAVPALIEALNDKDAEFRISAADALRRIAPEAAKGAGVN
jgi:HEAT repeat protein